jgi:hypothetical protein
MRDLTPNEIGSLLFKVRDDLELTVATLAKWRAQGTGSGGMVPLSIIVAETKALGTLAGIEDLIQLFAKVSRSSIDRY